MPNQGASELFVATTVSRTASTTNSSLPEMWRIPVLVVLLAAVAGAAFFLILPKSRRTSARPATTLSFTDLLTLSPAQLSKIGPTTVNLLCAQNLPGTETLDIPFCVRVLDQWAARVRTETERHLYRFRSAPSEYYDSEAYFRMLMMAVVLYEDCSVRYNPALIGDLGNTSAFFQDSRDLFLHGLCGERRMGTCSSMPVLYLAIGRRLGYPLKLVTTKSHVFLRWDTPEERFNLEATGRGMNRYDDNHFKQWPFPVSDEEIKNDGYLKSLSPPEELALFLSLRAQCLKVAGRLSEAAEAYRAAIRFAPESRPYRLLLAALLDERSAPAGAPVSYSLPPPALGPAPFPGAGHPAAPADPNPLRQIR
jgi:hypothetical protein